MSPAKRRTKVRNVLLTPGAGADRNQSALVAIDAALAGAGMAVERMDFPYRLAGRKAPDREPVLLDAVRSRAAGMPSLALGGRSMGGRICSMVVAEGDAGIDARALILVSYPLHPPGRPDRLRTTHFPDLPVPCLFVSGTRDAFGSPAKLESATAAIPGPVTHVWIDGKDHSLRNCDQQVAAAVLEWLSAL